MGFRWDDASLSEKASFVLRNIERFDHELEREDGLSVNDDFTQTMEDIFDDLLEILRGVKHLNIEDE